jgi:hypothetical protein
VVGLCTSKACPRYIFLNVVYLVSMTKCTIDSRGCHGSYKIHATLSPIDEIVWRNTDGKTGRMCYVGLGLTTALNSIHVPKSHYWNMAQIVVNKLTELHDKVSKSGIR